MNEKTSMTNVEMAAPSKKPNVKAGFGTDDPSGCSRRSDTRRGRGSPNTPYSSTLLTFLETFSEISLEETNKSASMLKRIDNKYVVDQKQLRSVLQKLKPNFSILTIDGRHIFSYESCYFDDDGRCFKEHQQGRRQRFKVRTRRYVESDMAFFEVKMKGKRGETDKSRQACDHFYSFEMNSGEQQMIADLYERTYGKVFHYRLAPALHVSYRRLTLVSVSGNERITIDLNLHFETPSGKDVFIGDDFVIVETKTVDGRGKADWALKRQHIRSVSGCSKYCIGMALTGEVSTYNPFRPIVRLARSRMLPPVDQRMLQK